MVRWGRNRTTGRSYREIRFWIKTRKNVLTAFKEIKRGYAKCSFIPGFQVGSLTIQLGSVF